MYQWLKRKLARKTKDTGLLQDELLPETGDEDLLQIRSLIQEVLGKDLDGGQLSLDMRLDDLGFDSIRYINLMLRLEDLVEIDIEEIAARIDLSRVQTVGDAAHFLGELKRMGRQDSGTTP